MTATDVLIVGGGSVGLALATLLNKSDKRHERAERVQVRVIDAGPAPTAFEPQQLEAEVLANGVCHSELSANVIAVNAATVNMLQATGAWQALPDAAATAYHSMRVMDGAGTGRIEFSAAQEGLTELGFIVDQNALRHALANTAQSKGAIINWQTRWNQVERTEGGYELTLDSGETIRAALLIGADGGASAIRQTLGLKTFGWRYDERAIVCIANTAKSHEQTAWQWFTESGPLAFLPLPHEQLVAVIWSSGEAADLLDASADTFRAALSAASEQQLGEVLGVTERLSFPLMHRHAQSYVDDHLAILGDAAHTIHPLAGQGANLGFADAKVLAQELTQATIEGASIGDKAALLHYQRRRRQENLAAGAAMEGLYRLFSATNPFTRLARSFGMKAVGGIPAAKSLAVAVATGRAPVRVAHKER